MSSSSLTTDKRKRTSSLRWKSWSVARSSSLGILWKAPFTPCWHLTTTARLLRGFKLLIRRSSLAQSAKHLRRLKKNAKMPTSWLYWSWKWCYHRIWLINLWNSSECTSSIFRLISAIIRARLHRRQGHILGARPGLKSINGGQIGSTLWDHS